MPQRVIGYDEEGKPVYAAPPPAPPARPSVTDLARQFLAAYAQDDPAIRAAIGATKGAGHTALTLGSLLHQIPGVRSGIDALYGQSGLSDAAFSAAFEAVKPSNTMERIGYGGEQLLELALPGGATQRLGTRAVAAVAPTLRSLLPEVLAKYLPRAAVEAGVGTAQAVSQGASPEAGAIGGAVGPIVSGVVGKVGDVVGNRAIPFVRSAIKPTVSAMRHEAGSAWSGLDETANKMARFVIDKRLMSAADAQKLVREAETEIQDAIAAAGDPVADAGDTILKFLGRFRQKAAGQLKRSGDIDIIEREIRDVIQGPLGKTVPVLDPVTGAAVVDARGNVVTQRVLRDDVTASEALTRARRTSQFETRKQYGEQKGTDVEAAKYVERGARSAVKQAVPATVAPFAQQSQAIGAREILDRMAMRTGNRDALSLPGIVGAAPTMAAGRIPILGIVAHALRNGQLRAGMWSDALGNALTRADEKGVVNILTRIAAIEAGKGDTDPMPSHALTVTAPDGTGYTFPTQQQADAFKQAAGIK